MDNFFECLDCGYAKFRIQMDECPRCGSSRILKEKPALTGLVPKREYSVNGSEAGNERYFISLHNYDNDWFVAYGMDESDALDNVVRFLEEKMWTGHLVGGEVVEEEWGEAREQFIVAGNDGWYVDSEHLLIQTEKVHRLSN